MRAKVNMNASKRPDLVNLPGIEAMGSEVGLVSGRAKRALEVDHAEIQTSQPIVTESVLASDGLTFDSCDVNFDQCWYDLSKK